MQTNLIKQTKTYSQVNKWKEISYTSKHLQEYKSHLNFSLLTDRNDMIPIF